MLYLLGGNEAIEYSGSALRDSSADKQVFGLPESSSPDLCPTNSFYSSIKTGDIRFKDCGLTRQDADKARRQKR